MLLPALNTISDYQFTTGFTSLNGIYTLVELLTYNQAVAQGVDFVANLYTPAGLSSTQYTTDASNYLNDTVLVLQSVNTTPTVTLYVPGSLLAMIPDSMVSCYNKLAIGVNLGVFADQTTLNWIITEINNILSSALGVTNPAVLYSLGTTYMRVSDYNTLVATREAAATGYNTTYQQLQEQIQENTNLQTLLTYYKNTLIALNAA